MPNGSGGVGSLMPSCLNRCSAVARREPSPLRILSLESVFIDLAPGFGLIVHILIFHSPIRGCAVIDPQRPNCPSKPPKRFSASPGLLKPRPISVLILCCVAGRAIEAMQASHPDPISISGGKLATLTRRLV